jgi:hypothetical protein
MSANAVLDMMGALNNLQAALDAGTVKLTPCDIHPELGLMVDHPAGRLRFTFALVEDGKVIAAAMFVVLTGRVQGLPCLHLGYAVIESRRNAGIGFRTLQHAVDELRNGLCRQNLGPFFLEAIVPEEDVASNKIARGLISDSPLRVTDAAVGGYALQYFRRIECDAANGGT